MSKMIDGLTAIRKKLWGDHSDVPMWKVMLLRDMAKMDIWPDGTFSDDELVIWDSYHQLYKEVGFTKH